MSPWDGSRRGCNNPRLTASLVQWINMALRASVSSTTGASDDDAAGNPHIGASECTNPRLPDPSRASRERARNRRRWMSADPRAAALRLPAAPLRPPRVRPVRRPPPRLARVSPRHACRRTTPDAGPTTADPSAHSDAQHHELRRGGRFSAPRKAASPQVSATRPPCKPPTPFVCTGSLMRPGRLGLPPCLRRRPRPGPVATRFAHVNPAW
jgi:hypothetical protein